MTNEVLVVGATARSAAQSAARAGWKVAAVDLFCDRDLRACSAAVPAVRYPNDLVTLAQQVSPRAWFYTGGLENEPDVVDSISRRHHLLGTKPAALRQVRDPLRLQQTLRAAGLSFPEVRDGPPLGEPGKWLRKTAHSCGGLQVVDWLSSRPAEGGYYQQHVRGPVLGAAFVGVPGRAKFLGVTLQLHGCRWAGLQATGLQAAGLQAAELQAAGARRYLYTGSVGPLTLRSELVEQFERIGRCLAERFQLEGLFGVDTIVNQGQVWVLEVNPRFTASLEVHERATGVSSFDLHLQACESSLLPTAVPTAPLEPAGMLHGKAVVYASRDGVMSASLCRRLDEQNGDAGQTRYADLPHADSHIRKGQPLLTVFAEASTACQVSRQLRSLAQDVQQAFDVQVR